MRTRQTIGWLAMAIGITTGTGGTAFGKFHSVRSLSEAVDEFGETLLSRELAARPNENVILSPASIHEAMMMVTLGAAGDTRTQLDAVLNITDLKKFQDDPASLFGKLPLGDPNKPATTMKSEDPDSYERTVEAKPLLFVTNRLWLAKDISIEPAYEKTLADQFHSKPTLLDFANHTADALAAINAGVANDTKGKIPHLLAPDAIRNDTRLVLTNAVYFKGAWVARFSEGGTKDAPFQTANGPVAAKSMAMTKNFQYAENDDQQLIALPYAGGEMAMLICLPKVGSKASPDWKALLGSKRIDLALPRFKFESSFKLGSELQSMGAALAFTDGANFTGITTKEPLKIGEVVHKALIDVNENGTEAAAATAVEMRVGAARMADEPVPMHVDRPFYFAIIHKPTGLQLFSGRVADPTK